MVGGQIPTSAGNSRLAALQARRRPTVDVSDQGIAIQSGGGRTPLLTNRVDALSDDALAGVQQRGFVNGRDAVSTAMDAAGRTFRTGLLEQDFERQDEAASVDRRMREADMVALQRANNAVGALKARGEHDIYFSPDAREMREDALGDKLALAETQQSGAIRKAEADEFGARADVEIARQRARGDEVEARLTGGSRALEALAAARAGLRPRVEAAKPGMLRLWGLFGGGTPASDPDAAVRQQYDAQMRRILDSLGIGVGKAPATPVNGVDPAPAPPVDQARALNISTFAQRHGISPEAAEAILLRHGVIQ